MKCTATKSCRNRAESIYGDSFGRNGVFCDYHLKKMKNMNTSTTEDTKRESTTPIPLKTILQKELKNPQVKKSYEKELVRLKRRNKL